MNIKTAIVTTLAAAMGLAAVAWTRDTDGLPTWLRIRGG